MKVLTAAVGLTTIAVVAAAATPAIYHDRPAAGHLRDSPNVLAVDKEDGLSDQQNRDPPHKRKEDDDLAPKVFLLFAAPGLLGFVVGIVMAIVSTPLSAWRAGLPGGRKFCQCCGKEIIWKPGRTGMICLHCKAIFPDAPRQTARWLIVAFSSVLLGGLFGGLAQTLIEEGPGSTMMIVGGMVVICVVLAGALLFLNSLLAAVLKTPKAPK